MNVNDTIKRRVVSSTKVKELDASINGPLIKIATVFGESVYIRGVVGDDESNKRKTEEVSMIIKDVVLGDVAYDGLGGQSGREAS